MKSALKNISLFGMIALCIMPTCLAIYQYFQFGYIAFNVSMMRPESIVRTGFSAILASTFLFAILKCLPLTQRPHAA